MDVLVKLNDMLNLYSSTLCNCVMLYKTVWYTALGVGCLH